MQFQLESIGVIGDKLRKEMELYGKTVTFQK